MDHNGHDMGNWEIRGGVLLDLFMVSFRVLHPNMQAYIVIKNHTVVGLGYDRSHMLHFSEDTYSGHLLD